MKPLDVQAIKQLALNHILEILHFVCGIPYEWLDGKEWPCVLCGGTTRARLIDKEKGAYRCSHCCPDKCGDIIAAVMHFCSVAFPEALRLIADYLGTNPVGGNRVAIPARVAKPVVKAASVGSVPKTNVKPKLLRTIKYEYLNGVGDFHVLVERLEFADGTKTFRQSHWEAKQGRFIIGTKGVIPIPWDAPSFKEASMIYWCEGEKKTVALGEVMAQHRPEICCSCRWGGSNSFPQKLVPWFHGKDVIVFADNDDAGARYAHMVASEVVGTAKSVKIVSFSDFSEKYDIADWIYEGEVAA